MVEKVRQVHEILQLWHVMLETFSSFRLAPIFNWFWAYLKYFVNSSKVRKFIKYLHDREIPFLLFCSIFGIFDLNRNISDEIVWLLAHCTQDFIRANAFTPFLTFALDAYDIHKFVHGDTVGEDENAGRTVVDERIACFAGRG